jgi:glycosyltransferase involved in cell wall biosynthesis
VVLEKKPRILIVADVRNWIFDRHAHVLQEGLRNSFDIDIAYMGSPIDEGRYDLIHPLEWHVVPLRQIHTRSKWVTGIRSHVSWGYLGFPAFFRKLRRTFQGIGIRSPIDWDYVGLLAVSKKLRGKFVAVYVVSRRLLNIFEPHVPGVRLLAHGVDTDYFRPWQQAGPSVSGRLLVGWAGNRMSPAKGFEAYVGPLANLPGVELVVRGYSDRLLDVAEMRDFYGGIDAYVCSSSSEGHNNALMEAAAMERAIVTTDVGTVPEYLVNEESALIVPRNFEAIAAAVARLRDDPDLRLRLGRQARLAVVAKYDWKERLEDYRAFFLEVLERSEGERPSIGTP